jgi:2-hydroxyacyl-CoA lyase 1
MPLVVLAGSAYGIMRGLGGFQEAISARSRARRASGRSRSTAPSGSPRSCHLALGKAASGRPGAVYLDFPGHLGRAQGASADARAARASARPRSRDRTPIPTAIDRIAALLARRERPLLLVGQGRGMGGAGAALRSSPTRHPLRTVADGARHDPRRSPLRS